MRSTSSGIRYAKAQVNNINGVILVPDNWSVSTYYLNNTNNSGAAFSSNVINASQWSTLQIAGAVFVPTTGFREGTSVENVGNEGVYWSVSHFDNYRAKGLDFYDNDVVIGGGYGRCFGASVRLVCPAN